MAGSSGLEWFINRTIGLPSQWSMRFLRVLQGKADPLSEKGFLDQSLLPIVGLFDGENEDATPEEVFGGGTGRQIALSILTDPLTYATGGLTAKARVASALGRGANSLHVVDPAALRQLPVGKAIQKLRDSVGPVADELGLPFDKFNKAMQHLDNAENQARKLGLLDMQAGRLLDESGKRQLIFGLPFAFKGMQPGIRINEKHRGWFSMIHGSPSMASKKMFGVSIPEAINNVAGRSVPVLSKFFRPIDQVIGGFQTGLVRRADFAEGYAATPAARERLAEAGGYHEFGTVLSNSDEVHKKLFKDSRLHKTDAGLPLATEREQFQGLLLQHMRQGRTPEDSFRLLLTNIKKSKDVAEAKRVKDLRAAWKKLRADVGLPEKDLSWQNLHGFHKEFYDRRNMDLAIYRQIKGENLVTEAISKRPWMKVRKDTGKLPLTFEIPEKLANAWQHLFAGAGGAADVIEAARGRRRLQAIISRAQDEHTKRFAKMVMHIAKVTGQSPEDVTSGLSFATQIVPHSDELQLIASAKAGLVDPEDVLRWTKKNLGRYIDRMTDVKVALGNGETTGVAGAVGRGLTRLGVKTVPGEAIRGQNSVMRQLSRQQLRLQMWAEGAVKAAADGVDMPVPVALFDQVERSMNRVRRLVMKEITDVGGQPVQDYMEGIAQLQGQHLKLARILDGAGEAVPIAHYPRVLSKAETERWQLIWGGQNLDKSEAAIVNKVRTLMKREMDDISVETLDDFLEQARRQAYLTDNEEGLGKLIEKITDVAPELAHKYSTTPHVGLLTSLGALREMQLVGDTINGLVNARHSTKTASLFGGELLAVGSAARILKETAGVTSKFRIKNQTLETFVTRNHRELPDTWALVRSQRTGRPQFVSLWDQEAQDMVLAELGRGDTVGDAANRLFARGQLGTAKVSSMKPADLENMVGKQVMFGPSTTMNAVAGALNMNQTLGGPLVRALLDPMHNVARAAVTVIRPGFHMFNWTSSAPMLMMNGMSFGNWAAAHRDAFALLTNAPEFPDAMGRASVLLRDDFGWFGKTAHKVPGVARAHRWFRRAGSAFSEMRATATLGRRSVAQQGFVTPMGVIDPAQFWEELAQTPLFSSNFAVGGRVGVETAAFRKSSDAVKLAGDHLREFAQSKDLARLASGMTTRGARMIRSLGESSENLTRLVGVFGYMRQGYSVRQAAEATLHALFDYNDLTRAEQMWAKRLFSFYTFPRKMIPATLKFANRDPGKFATSIKALFGLSGAETDFGELQLRVWDNYRVNLQRSMPHLDALSAGYFLGDMFLPWSKLTPERSRAPLSFNIPGELLMNIIPKGYEGRVSKVYQEILRLSYMTRWALSRPDDPLNPEPTMWTGIAREVFGVSAAGKAARLQWLQGQHAMIEGEIRERIKEEEDPEDREVLVEELQKLNFATQRMLQ